MPLNKSSSEKQKKESAEKRQVYFQMIVPLMQPIKTWYGVGPRVNGFIKKLLKKDNDPTLLNLLFHLPSGFVKRHIIGEKDNLSHFVSQNIIFKGTVSHHIPSKNNRQPYKIVVCHETAEIILTYFKAKPSYLKQVLELNQAYYIYGKLDHFQGHFQITHPDKVELINKHQIDDIEVVYPMTGGLSPKFYAKLIKASLESLSRANVLPEWLDQSLITKHQWPDWKSSLLSIHSPKSEADLSYNTASRQRLSYDECLATQLALQLMRNYYRKKEGRSLKSDLKHISDFVNRLPFEPTICQEKAIDDIISDLSSPYQMNRLLQGDVGSGKTLVAQLTMLYCVNAGKQAVLMAPTDILAYQHYENFLSLFPNQDEIVYLSGQIKGKKRKAVYEAIATGKAKYIIGTHALFQKDVDFHDLGYCIIDEQHRFGVKQRLALSQKGKGVDLLVMSATPIPRTQLMVGYGDMDISFLKEKPKGRQKIKTSLISKEKLGQIIEAVGRAVKEDKKIYWVCPLVDESETLDLAAAEERFNHLKHFFGDKVALVHGKMKADEKSKVMAEFSNPSGQVKILVATTVIEVGVNVPEASIMIIEHAERFGLAQLHQLRGRVGRGSIESSCTLLYDHKLSKTGQERLRIMRDTDDGFLIAEADLKIRGAGEILGTSQSGLPQMKFVDLDHHERLLSLANKEAKLICTNDPKLTSERGLALRLLLKLFGKDSVLDYVYSG